MAIIVINSLMGHDRKQIAIKAVRSLSSRKQSRFRPCRKQHCECFVADSACRPHTLQSSKTLPTEFLHMNLLDCATPNMRLFCLVCGKRNVKTFFPFWCAMTRGASLNSNNAITVCLCTVCTAHPLSHREKVRVYTSQKDLSRFHFEPSG